MNKKQDEKVGEIEASFERLVRFGEEHGFLCVTDPAMLKRAVKAQANNLVMALEFIEETGDLVENLERLADGAEEVA